MPNCVFVRWFPAAPLYRCSDNNIANWFPLITRDWPDKGHIIYGMNNIMLHFNNKSMERKYKKYRK
jgi:hypothetical protein